MIWGCILVIMTISFKPRSFFISPLLVNEPKTASVSCGSRLRKSCAFWRNFAFFFCCFIFSIHSWTRSRLSVRYPVLFVYPGKALPLARKLPRPPPMKRSILGRNWWPTSVIRMSKQRLNFKLYNLTTSCLRIITILATYLRRFILGVPKKVVFWQF